MSQAMKLKRSRSMAFFDAKNGRIIVNRVLAIVLITLTVVVSAPLSIKTYQEGGGPWGFGVIGLHILVPLCTYILFAVSALLNNKRYQWTTFVAAHLVSLWVGLLAFLIFPILPKSILLVPALLAVVGILNKRRMSLYLCLMLTLGVAANALLLKWEFDFKRTFPIIELFQHITKSEP
jgi:hypothetical protein